MRRKTTGAGNFAIALLLSIFTCGHTNAQPSKMKVRIAKIMVDSSYLDAYRSALAEHAAIAVKTEPGVLTLNAVYDKQHPT